jgi:outer membrane protein OmpA-like peptidoglycan-associated protein
VSIYGVHFDTGKWNIKKDSKPALKEMASFLKNHQENKYFIVGHTDNTGDFSSNMTLSEKRAKAVIHALIDDYGVKAQQLEAYGISSLSPVTSNSTDEGKARNRRVEIVKQ